MPTYVYQCDSCQHGFEAVQKITADSLKDCPECGKPTLRRLVTAAAFHLKGNGWYKTDYASGTNSSSSSSPSTSSSTNTVSSTPKEVTKSEPVTSPAATAKSEN